MKAEAKIEDACCRYARQKYGALTPKFVSPNNRGVPDRIFLFPGGHTLFVEFKAPGKKPTALQDRKHEELREQGFSCWVVDGAEWFKSLLDIFAKSRDIPVKKVEVTW